MIRQLDENATELMQLVAAESKQLISSDMTLENRREKLQIVGQLLNEALKKGEEKFALAKSTYDTVSTIFIIRIKKNDNPSVYKKK